MKKEKTEIAVNTSSGAEKVETVQESKKADESQVKRVKKTQTPIEESAVAEAALGHENKAEINAKKANGALSGSKAEKESKAAKVRVQQALKKQKNKEKQKKERLEKAKQRAEKRKKLFAEKKAALAKRIAENRAQIARLEEENEKKAQERKAKKEELRKERAHAKANKKQNAQRKAKSRENGNGKNNRRQHGYGGWLAAVISLGAVTLALTTALTVGALDMNSTKKGIASGYRGTMYELTGVMEHVDSDLERIRISESPAQQSRILTDLLVQARLAEQDLEKLPIEAEADRNITVFINRTAAACERMLAKLRHGEELSQTDKAKLEALYQTNHTIRTELNKLMNGLQDKDLMDFIKKGIGKVGDVLKDLEQMTLEENRSALAGAKEKMDEIKRKIGGEKSEKPETEQGKSAKIEPAQAEELCSSYFADYPISKFQCIGETAAPDYKAYNVQGYDDKGTLLFAEVSQDNGALLRFDYYEECNTETFDMENAKRIAESFLEKLGYVSMEAVRVREDGTTTDFTYVYSQNGVAYYPDEVRIKVCRTRGVVTGLDCMKYIQNHNERIEPDVKITLAQAYDKLHKGLKVESSRLAVVQTARGNVAAYEFLCSYKGEQYFIYLAADTGEEISIINAKGIA